MVNDDLVQLQKYRGILIFPLKHHTQSTESGFQDIEVFSATGISEEDASTLVSLHPIKITPINCEFFLKLKEGREKVTGI